MSIFAVAFGFLMAQKWHIRSVFASQAEGLTPALQAEMDVKDAIQLQQAENGEVVQIQMPGTWATHVQTSHMCVNEDIWLESRREGETEERGHSNSNSQHKPPPYVNSYWLNPSETNAV